MLEALIIWTILLIAFSAAQTVLPTLEGFDNQGNSVCGLIELEDEIWFNGTLKNKIPSAPRAPNNNKVIVKFGEKSKLNLFACEIDLSRCDPEHPTCRCDKSGFDQYSIAVRPIQQLMDAKMSLVVEYKALNPPPRIQKPTPIVIKPALITYQVDDEEEVHITAPETEISVYHGNPVKLKFKVAITSDKAKDLNIILSINGVKTRLNHPQVFQEVSIVETVPTSGPAHLNYHALTDGGDSCWSKTFLLTFNVRTPAWQLALAGMVMALLVVALLFALNWLREVSKKKRKKRGRDEDEWDEIDVEELVVKKPKQKAGPTRFGKPYAPVRSDNDSGETYFSQYH